MDNINAPYLSNPDMHKLIQQQAQYAFHSEKYLYDIMRFTCVEWQAQACHDYDTIGHCAWSTGSGVGKTALLARLLIHFLHTRPDSIIPCTAPTQRQLYNVLWAEASRALHKSELLMTLFEWQQERIYFKQHKDTWFAVAIVSTPPKPGSMTTESLQGYHADNILFLIDECSGIADQILGAADGAMSTPNARAILASNPTRNTGYFYRATNDPALNDLWARIFVDAEKVNAVYVNKAYISRLKTIYGEQSDYFRMRVRGLPPRHESTALVSPEQIFAAHSRNIPREGNFYIGLDPARYGDDDTVLFIRQGNVVFRRECVHGMSTMEVSRLALDLIYEYNPVEVRIDVIGIGSGVYDRLEEDLAEKAHILIPVHVGANANDKEHYFNLRSEIGWQLRGFIDKIAIPIETPNLDEELTVMRYGWDSKDKRIRLESKDVTKSRLNPTRSPNDADALILACCDLEAPTGIVTPEYFKTGRTNPYGATVEGLVESLHSEGKGVRSGLELEVFLKNGFGKSALGSNRYKEFKDKFEDGSFSSDMFSNTVH